MDENEIAWGARLPPGFMIRPATDDDFDARRTIFDANRDLERQLSGWPDSVWTSFINRQFELREADWRQTYPDAEWLVITLSGTNAVVGAVTLARVIQLDDPEPGPPPVWCHIVDIGIDAAHQSRGLGTRMIKALAKAARIHKIAGLSLRVRSDNQAARRLYTRLGFSPVDAGDGTTTLMRRDR